MRWSEEAWKASLPVYKQITQMPFIQELLSGTLAKEKFVFYIQQDALYLNEYGKVLTGIAAKLEHKDYRDAFMSFSKDTMSVEHALHATFVEELKDNKALMATPSCLLYTSYLKSQLGSMPLEVALGAVLPCFWVYKKVGDFILEHQTKEENPYQDWINTYGGAEFEAAVVKAIAICDVIADRCTEEQRAQMTKAYIMCTKLEWLFWDSAYRLEEWGV